MCSDSLTCVAVGTRAVGAANKSLIKSWNGTSWSVASSPNPPGKTDAVLGGVECQSGTSCFAVGSYATKTWSRTLIEQWNGINWSIVPSPNPHGLTFATLTDVTCTSATHCLAVGSYAVKTWSRTLIEQWNGTNWSIVPSPNPHGLTFAALDGLTCPGATSCYAVGTYSTHSWGRTLIEHWNGSSWAIVASPNPPGKNFAAVGSLACPSDTSCLAVGFFMTDSTAKTLVERWNGTRWSIVSSPNPPPGLLEFAGLGGVDCASGADCYAVGFAVSGFGSRVLIEHWDGTTWSIATNPDQPGTKEFPALLDVACPSSTSCHAVGFSADKALIERWDGTRWAADPT